MSTSNDFQLATSSPVPLYNQIREAVRNRILDGSYMPLSRLPSESELGAAFKVSRITIRQALNDLQKDGFIFRIPGKGTFVAKPKTYQNITTLQGLGESLSRLGHEVTNQVKSFRYINAFTPIAERLNEKLNQEVTEIKRVRFANREPLSVEVTYVSVEIGRVLENANLVSRDIFLILENDLGLMLGHADLAIDAIQANAELASALRIAEGAPIMRIERTTHTEDKRPISFEYLYYRGDSFQYRLRTDRQRPENGRSFS